MTAPTDREMLREKRQLSESLEQAIRSRIRELQATKCDFVGLLLGEVDGLNWVLTQAGLAEEKE